VEEDNILIEYSLKGDIHAFGSLVNKYQNTIYSYLLKVCQSKEDAEDLTQEVFIKVYNNLYKFNYKCKLLTWIFKIAINTFKTEYRKRKKLFVLESDEVLAYMSCDISDFPEQIYERKETLKEAVDMLNKLDFEQKNALLLKYVHDFSHKEIGQILGISEAAVKMKVYRAKKNICDLKADPISERGVLSEAKMPY
jgi:RNA polymerase sigma-70 factor (ECF subfamily)